MSDIGKNPLVKRSDELRSYVVACETVLRHAIAKRDRGAAQLMCREIARAASQLELLLVDLDGPAWGGGE